MKTKEFKGLKELSKEELLLKLEELQKKLFDLKLKHSTVKIKNPLEIRNVRRDIARIKTLIKEKFNIKI
ncbi:MAG: 50S ribosomal protein L29 [Endomicrobiia bacterium]